MKIRIPNQIVLIIISVCTFVVVLLTDIFTQLIYTHWLFYILPLLIVYPTENQAATYAILSLSAVALVIGQLFSSTNISFENIHIISAINRITGFFVLLLFTIIINKLIQTRKHYQRVSSELAYSNKELESFSYSAAHDLKAPLRAIRGFSDILMEDHKAELDEEAQMLLARISSSTEKMSRLIEDMLSLSKVASQEISPHEVNLSQIAHSIIDDFRTREPNRKAEVRIEEELRAIADPDLIRIVLTNLLGNAWKFSSRKEVSQIYFGSKKGKEAQVFFIKDNGSGFDMANQSRLFEPFKRLHSESEFLGTGIGLSIVKRIIIKHGGEIWAQSEVDKGAVFYFTLPKSGL
ncbi:MAG: hypothetical protein GX267_11805 [Fibrobacter sp.]|jgi:signal transduction histidine kinase|nr:hypothetical protein [Fibrobacter sp.]